ncbi:glycoside hydrolase family 88 protein [Paenibacillus sp. GCM10027627]|uniref:glycoside hydrolase family 88 protein n=1 Tax=unclassified Paenibacillus TaxID=185978 RepID=UPI00362659F2
MGIEVAGAAAAVLLIIVVGAVLLLDFMPIAGTWLGRIHIGRHPEEGKWHVSVARRSLKWLNDTPIAKVTDNTRLTVIDRIKGQYSASALQDWQQAALLLGLAEGLEREEQSAVRAEIDAFLASKFDAGGNWKKAPLHVDSAILAYAVMKVPGLKIEAYKPAMDNIHKLLLDHVGDDETVRYRKSMSHYRYVDTIGFVCPFLVAYGMKFGDPSSLELAMKQIRAYVRFGFHEQTGLPFHAYDARSHSPLGLVGWGRGLGWFAIGLIDMWDELPRNHAFRAELRPIIVSFAKAVLNGQQPHGAWNWTVTRSECRADSSATAMLGWYLARAAEIAEIEESAANGALRSLAFLRSATRRDGAVDFSQGDTKDIGVYSTQFGLLPFAQGFASRLGQRALRESHDRGQGQAGSANGKRHEWASP